MKTIVSTHPLLHESFCQYIPTSSGLSMLYMPSYYSTISVYDYLIERYGLSYFDVTLLQSLAAQPNSQESVSIAGPYNFIKQLTISALPETEYYIIFLYDTVTPYIQLSTIQIGDSGIVQLYEQKILSVLPKWITYNGVTKDLLELTSEDLDVIFSQVSTINEELNQSYIDILVSSTAMTDIISTESQLPAAIDPKIIVKPAVEENVIWIGNHRRSFYDSIR